MPCYIGDLIRDPNLENQPHQSRFLLSLPPLCSHHIEVSPCFMNPHHPQFDSPKVLGLFRVQERFRTRSLPDPDIEKSRV